MLLAVQEMKAVVMCESAIASASPSAIASEDYEFPEPGYIKALPCNQKVQLRLTGIQTGVVANSITNQWAFKLSDGKISNGFTGALIP